jgi:hypothetical protein
MSKYKIVHFKSYIDGQVAKLLEQKNDNVKEILKEIKSNNAYKDTWNVINNLQETKNITEENVDIFVNENIDIARTIDLKEVNQFLNTIDCNIQLSKLDESINVLLFEEKSPTNIQKYIDAKHHVREHLLENTRIKEILCNLYENKNLSEPILQEFYDAENKETFFSSQKNKTCQLITEKISSENVTDADKLLLFEAREKINNLPFNEQNMEECVINMISLFKDE